MRSRAIAVGSLFPALVATLAACATASPAVPSPPGAGVAPHTAADGGTALDGASPADPVASLATLDALAARAPTLAPTMREIARGERSDVDASPVAIVRDAPSDTCVRVAVAAAPRVHASLVSTRTRDPLADDADAGGDVALGAAGPVCVRRGDGIELRFEGRGEWRARYVAWQSGK